MEASEVVEDILEHFGKKGMKWGVRQDKKFTKQAGKLGTKIDIHNAVGKTWQPDLDRINAKYAKEIDKGTLLNTDHPVTKAYNKEVMDSYIKRLNEAAGTMTSKTGNLTYSVQRNDYDTLGFTVTTKEVKHADSSFRINFVKDDQGRIIGLELSEIAQSDLEEFLAHFGVKGMKWGVRRKATVGPQEVVISDKRKIPGFAPRIKTRGGEGHPTSPDAAKAARIGQIGKKSGVKALSDKELQDYTKRLQLEQNVKRLNYESSSPPRKFVKKMLMQGVNTTAQTAGNEASAQVVKRSLKLAAAAGIAA